MQRNMLALVFCIQIFAFLCLESTNGTPKTLPPFTVSLDQSVPCPYGTQDFSVVRDSRPPVSTTDKELHEFLESIPAHLDDAMETLNAPSASVVIVQGGQVLQKSYRGTTRLGQQIPPQDDTTYQIASISKTFTSTMMYQLRDRGKLPQGLDTAVTTLIPEFKVSSMYPSSRPITLRALAMHASGLMRETPDCSYRSPPCNQSTILEEVSRVPVISPQFEATHYSNLGVALLGRALAVAANKSYEDYIVQDLMRPLGMVDSGTPLNVNASRMAQGVDPVSGALASFPNESHWSAPAGELHASPRDMAIWMNFLLDQGTPAERAKFARVLDPASRREMTRTMMLQGDGMSGVGGGTFEVAFMRGRWAANKLGCLDGYRSAITLVPSLGVGVFGVATSTCDLRGDGDAVSFPLASTLIPIVDRLLKERADQLTSSTPVPKAAMEAVLGTWCHEVPRTVRLEPVPGSSSLQQLVMRGSSDGIDPPYPYSLMWVRTNEEGTHIFRRLMGPEQWLTFKACSLNQSGTEVNVCPTSCFRKMARGSGEFVYVGRDKKTNRSFFNDPGVNLCYR